MALVNKKIPFERQRQQSIALANRATDNGCFVYDIDYTQPKEKQGEQKSGCFDILALKIENHKATQLLLIEVKTKASACTGNSGVKKHIDDMELYMKQAEIINVRRKEAEEVMDALDKIFQVGKVDFSGLDKNTRSIFIYTDEAQSYIKEAQKYMGEAQKYKGVFSHEVLNEPWEFKNI